MSTPSTRDRADSMICCSLESAVGLARGREMVCHRLHIRKGQGKAIIILYPKRAMQTQASKHEHVAGRHNCSPTSRPGSLTAYEAPKLQHAFINPILSPLDTFLAFRDPVAKVLSDLYPPFFARANKPTHTFKTISTPVTMFLRIFTCALVMAIGVVGTQESRSAT